MSHAGSIRRALSVCHGAGAALATGALAAVIATALQPAAQASSQLPGGSSGPAGSQTAQVTAAGNGYGNSAAGLWTPLSAAYSPANGPRP